MRIGLIGCGRWGRLILRDLVALGCEVAVVARSGASRGAALEGGAGEIVAGVDELPSCDGVVVATPIATHADVVAAALGHGVPVFVEKPLTDDAEAAGRLASVAPDRLFVMDKWRYHPGVELLGEIARGEELGGVVGLRTLRVGWGNPHAEDAVWVLAPHELSIALEILGALPAPRSAVADTTDHHATGLIGLLGERPWHALELSTRSPERRRAIVLECEEGVALLRDAYSDRVELFRDGPEPVADSRPISTELPLARELRAFVDHLRGGPPPRSSAAEGAAVVRAIAELRGLAGLAA
jgi:predicted dehydrogenase